MSYIADALMDMRAEMPGEDGVLLLLYTLLGLTLGGEVCAEQVHDAWALWAYWQGRTDHLSMIPFSELPEHVKGLDTPYVDAIRRAIRRAAAKRTPARRNRPASCEGRE